MIAFDIEPGARSGARKHYTDSRSSTACSAARAAAASSASDSTGSGCRSCTSAATSKNRPSSYSSYDTPQLDRLADSGMWGGDRRARDPTHFAEEWSVYQSCAPNPGARMPSCRNRADRPWKRRHDDKRATPSRPLRVQPRPGDG